MINPYIFLLKYLHDTNNRFFVNLTVEIMMVDSENWDSEPEVCVYYHSVNQNLPGYINN